MKGLATLVISMSTNPNVQAFNDILGNSVQFGQDPLLF